MWNLSLLFPGTGANSDRSVIIVSNYDSTMLKNLTVIFDSGVAVGVASSNSRLLHVTTKIPHKYFVSRVFTVHVELISRNRGAFAYHSMEN